MMFINLLLTIYTLQTFGAGSIFSRWTVRCMRTLRCSGFSSFFFPNRKFITPRPKAAISPKTPREANVWASALAFSSCSLCSSLLCLSSSSSWASISLWRCSSCISVCDFAGNVYAPACIIDTNCPSMYTIAVHPSWIITPFRLSAAANSLSVIKCAISPLWMFHIALPLTIFTPSTDSVSTTSLRCWGSAGCGLFCWSLFCGRVSSIPNASACLCKRCWRSRLTSACTPCVPRLRKVPGWVKLSIKPFLPASEADWDDWEPADNGCPQLVQNFCPALMLLFPHFGHFIIFLVF